MSTEEVNLFKFVFATSNDGTNILPIPGVGNHRFAKARLRIVSGLWNDEFQSSVGIV